MPRRVSVLALCLALMAAGAPAGEIELRQLGRVEVAPTRTSIYIGTVAMTLPPFARVGQVYETTYSARVFPYFFYNEHGRLSVEMGDEALRRLEQGDVVEFKGRAVRSDGTERPVEGKATPADARSGKIKVRVFVSKRIELIFNTTYVFPDVPPATPALTAR